MTRPNPSSYDAIHPWFEALPFRLFVARAPRPRALAVVAEDDDGTLTPGIYLTHRNRVILTNGAGGSYSPADFKLDLTDKPTRLYAHSVVGGDADWTADEGALAEALEVYRVACREYADARTASV